MIDVLQATERPGEAFENCWRRSVKRRLIAILVLITAWAVIVQGRLIWLQVVQHDYYLNKALSQQNRRIHPPALRGDIQDRHGEILATSADAWAVVADPSSVEDPVAAASQLCAAFRDCAPKEQADLVRKLSAPNNFAYLRRWRSVSAQQAQRVTELGLAGVSLMTEPGRYYPNTNLAAHILGFVGSENEGLGGIEATYDKLIKGDVGQTLVQFDGGRHAMQAIVEREPTPGATLELTIDKDFQYIAERELEIAVKENNARGGTVIIMDPHNGEIRALANAPTFNPNAYNLSSAEDRRNRATQEVYEPGSTFKIVTASAAIEEGVLKATDLIDCNPGVITFPGRKPITEAQGHNYGVLPFEDVIVKSSNIGAIKAGLRVGADRLGRYVHRFGFGEAIGSDFGGESAGIVWSSNNMTDSTLASMSMGYNVSVTPLQMAMAASAVANGGKLYEPHVVGAITKDNKREVIEPKVIRDAINADTAATITTFMEAVVERGTAKAAQMDHYQVAGKTGTASRLENGHYSESDYNASFVGFVPSRQPEYTILVVIDTPRAGHHYGGDTAAPVFKRIAQSILRLAAVPPTVRPTPPVVMTVDGMRPEPAPVVIQATASVGGQPVMPDVRGLGAHDALLVLGKAGLAVRMKGTGFVVSQTPDPGRAVDPGDVSVLELRRKPEPARPAGGGNR